MTRQDARAYRAAIEAGANAVERTDAEALAVKDIYPMWSGKSVAAYDGKDGVHPVTRVRGLTSGLLYKCLQGHTTQEDWPPEATPALWAVVNEANKGTIDDPIPAERGMEYTYGLYYYDSEDGGIYLCEREGEAAGGTVVLHYMPHQLVGSYFATTPQM
ncbi:MAG: hypothetical protein IKA50_01850 [Clostridia bacterium]|nr:hypothetical protein [Clostridia bacterium]